MARLKRRMPGKLVAGLVVAIALDTLYQLLFKHTVPQAGGAGAGGKGVAATLWGTLTNPLIILCLVLNVARFVNWVTVLGEADLSFAQPITSLSYLSVAFFSAVLFHEHISLWRGVGTLLILAGVYLISTTGHRTTGPGGRGT